MRLIKELIPNRGRSASAVVRATGARCWDGALFTAACKRASASGYGVPAEGARGATNDSVSSMRGSGRGL